MQPLGGEEAANVIDFDFVAAHVGQFDDPLSRRFVAYLQRWKSPAGARLRS